MFVSLLKVLLELALEIVIVQSRFDNMVGGRDTSPHAQQVLQYGCFMSLLKE